MVLAIMATIGAAGLVLYLQHRAITTLQSQTPVIVRQITAIRLIFRRRSVHIFTSSTRRFCCRPSCVSFGPAGLLAPRPFAWSRARSIVNVDVR